MKCTINVVAAIAMSVILVPGADALAEDGEGLALGTGFTYQGALEHEGVPADGIYDFGYELYDRAEGGTFLGRITKLDEEVSNGVFTSELDFGTSITGAAMWLEITVREAGNGPFTVLTPRQHLTKSISSGCTVDSDLVVTGSNLVVGGNLDFGYQRVVASCDGGSQNWCVASCPAGKKVISGGCDNGDNGAVWPIVLNYPDSDTSWYCAWQAAVANANHFEAIAVCANID